MTLSHDTLHTHTHMTRTDRRGERTSTITIKYQMRGIFSSQPPVAEECESIGGWL